MLGQGATHAPDVVAHVRSVPTLVPGAAQVCRRPKAGHTYASAISGASAKRAGADFSLLSARRLDCWRQRRPSEATLRVCADTANEKEHPLRRKRR